MGYNPGSYKFFWSLELPLAARQLFIVPGGSYTTLPFGWNLSPFLAQKTLESLVYEFFALPEFTDEDFTFFVYLDDILILGNSPKNTKRITKRLVGMLESRNLIISKKSVQDPTQNITWLGKSFDLKNRSCGNTEKTMCRLAGMTLMAGLFPCSTKRLQSLAGLWNWAHQPRVGFMAFAHPLFRFLEKINGRPALLPSSILQLVWDGVIISWKPLQTPQHIPHPLLSPFLFTDAAESQNNHDTSTYQAGIISSTLGSHIFQYGWENITQQQAELYAITKTVALAGHVGYSSASIVGDNMASLYSLLKLQPFRGNHISCKMVRSIFNIIQERKMVLHIFWCPTAFMPADPLSRVNLKINQTIQGATDFSTEKMKMIFSDFSTLTFLGTIWV